MSPTKVGGEISKSFADPNRNMSQPTSRSYAETVRNLSIT